MIELSLIKDIIKLRKRANYTRQQILQIQEESFRELITHAWNYSKFYKELYSSHGIKKQDLKEVAITDLPLISKELLMDNFDDVVTDTRLKKSELEKWIETHNDPTERYLNEFVILHTSGTSGAIGIFVYDTLAWSILKASIVTRISSPSYNPLKKTRVAYFAATNGRFAGVTLASSAPPLFYKFLPLSILDPLTVSCKLLNDFQPQQLSGYASTVASLANCQQKGSLKISPQRIMVSGDVLTDNLRDQISRSWNAPIINLYAASESIGITAQLPNHKDMTVFDDLHNVEVLDDQNNTVSAGNSGRIILTNLYNKTLPIIRYEMRDVATRATTLSSNEQFSTLKSIHGRQNDNLPITLNNNELDNIHPIILSEFFVPGLEKIQFISKDNTSILIYYQAKKNLDKLILQNFQDILKQKRASNSMEVQVEKVELIPNEAKTGKLKLVKLSI
ncbi:MAG: hypothetical protein Q8P90_00310 [bacterium]|nr:hypothetical protein [bacterium]